MYTSVQIRNIALEFDFFKFLSKILLKLKH
jgi:hypothetical protein